MSRYRCPGGRFHKWVFVRGLTPALTLYRCKKCSAERTVADGAA